MAQGDCTQHSDNRRTGDAQAAARLSKIEANWDRNMTVECHDATLRLLAEKAEPAPEMLDPGSDGV